MLNEELLVVPGISVWCSCQKQLSKELCDIVILYLVFIKNICEMICYFSFWF